MTILTNSVLIRLTKDIMLYRMMVRFISTHMISRDESPMDFSDIGLVKEWNI
jgi:hypothetical protein